MFGGGNGKLQSNRLLVQLVWLALLPVKLTYFCMARLNQSQLGLARTSAMTAQLDYQHIVIVGEYRHGQIF